MGLGDFAKGALGGGLFSSKGRDLLLGKKSEGSAASYSELDPMQKKAMGIYGRELDDLSIKSDPAAIAKSQIAQQERGIRSGAQDAQRQAQQLVAQRGLGRSSVGLNAILGVNRDLNDRIFANRSLETGLANQYQNQFANDRINRLGALSGGINSTLNTRMYTPEVKGGVRGGGLLAPILGIAGTALGAKYGGPAGAAAGYQVGSGIGNSFSNYGG